jgi:hypothetical protein
MNCWLAGQNLLTWPSSACFQKGDSFTTVEPGSAAGIHANLEHVHSTLYALVLSRWLNLVGSDIFTDISAQMRSALKEILIPLLTSVITNHCGALRQSGNPYLMDDGPKSP